MKNDNDNYPQTGFGPDFGHRRRGLRPPVPPAFAAARPGFGGGFGHGHGPRGGPFGPRGRARRGDVRLAILSLLADAPNNGYGLIKAIAEKTDDTWRASPGSVYPTLSQLVDEKLVSGTEGGDYTLSDDGRAYVAEHTDELAAVWQVGPKVSGEQAALIEATRKLAGAIRQVGTDGSTDKQAAATEKVDALRKDLYRLLGE
ncbi:MAG TPA: PadR family transcriptional regulator [Jatrophihabitantaceae bacterium]|jgi:DNA-binding PadR family transcriptional regulator